MPSALHGDGRFKRQVVIRVGPEDWPLLERAAHKHGSLQAALLAGLRALAESSGSPEASASADKAKTSIEKAAAAKHTAPLPATPRAARPPARSPAAAASAPADPDEELRAREAAQLLGLKPSTVAGYIRSGRLPGRYDGSPTWLGWLTTRKAVAAYRAR